jgi:hypothetical protein
VQAWRETITQKLPVGNEQAHREHEARLARQAEKLRRLVWEPVQQQLPQQTHIVYLAPDGELTQLPWAALPGSKQDTVLLDDYAVAVLPHGPFLLEQLSPPPPRSAKRPRPAEGLLLVGGVRYDDNPVLPRDCQPPEQVVGPQEPGRPWLSRRGWRIDFAGRDAANRRLGQLGEEFVVWSERRRLLVAGRDDLAQKVEWVTQTAGDGLGFDVLSFDDADDSEKLVEVKTTGLGKFFPFYVTANEVRCSEDQAERFHLFRVFDFAQSPRVYVLSGSLRRTCRLEATVFRATLQP